VTLIHRSGSSEDPRNFTPISVVPVILEKILSFQLVQFIIRMLHNFLNLRKAFDSLDHVILLQRLILSWGV